MEPTIYLFFNGNCLEAMNHYAEVLGGQTEFVIQNAQAPDAESRMPGGDDLVMHMRMRFGQTIVMASDSPPDWYDPPKGFNVQLAAASVVEFERLHAGLSADALSEAMAPGETFWAERFAMFTDRYGTPWMLNFEGRKAQWEEA